MSTRSRKSIKLAPGIKVNFNKKSASVTIGNKYAHVTKSSTGRTTTSINPVKGFSYTHVQTTGRSNKSSSNSLKTQASMPIDTNSTTSISKAKNKWITFFLCLFTIFGHKFYERKIGLGILYLCTIGLFGIGWIVDLISILLKPNPYYI